MFGRKKKKKDGILNKKSKEIEKVSHNQIIVKIYSALGGDLRVIKAKYTAVEIRNDFGELVSINDKFSHDEDVNFYERIDFVFVKAPNAQTYGESFVLGDELRDRTPSGLWPSDHGGVVTKLTFPIIAKLATR